MNYPRLIVIKIIVIGIIISAAVLSISCSSLYKPSIPKGVEPIEVSAAIVQANTALFKAGLGDNPAGVIFTLDPQVSHEKLKHLAKAIFSLKGTTPSDLDKRLIAQAVTDETYRIYEFKRVPYSISGSNDVYIAHVFVERDKLSAGYLQEGVLLKCNLYLIGGGKPHDGQRHALIHIGEVKAN